MRSRLRRRLLLCAASFALSLVVAELVLERRWPVRRTTYRLDPVLLHDSIPGSRRIQRMPSWAGGARNLVRFNDVGCRGAQLESPKTRRRLVVLGDSLVLAANVSEAETLPARLGEELGAGYEVVNAGLESYGPDQTLLRLERDFDKLDPDALLLVLCATNDFGDLLRNKLFRLERGRLERTQAVLTDAAREPFERHAREASAPALVRTFLDWRETRAAAAREREAPATGPDLIAEYLAQTEWEYRNAVLERDTRVYSLQQDAYDADVAIRPDGESSRAKQRLMTAVLRRLRERCVARGIPCALVVVPSAIDLDPTFLVRVDRDAHPTYSPTALSDAMSRCGREAGFEVLDLTAEFAARVETGLFVGRDDFHWNRRGIALAAATLRPWLPQLPGW